MLQEGLFAKLAADSTLSAVVGDRIFAGVAPDDATQFPCLVYSLVGGSSDQTLDTSGVAKQRVEVSAESFGSYAQAAQLRAAVIAVLEGWSEDQLDGTRILDTLNLNPGTDLVTEQRCFRCLAEFYVFTAQP